MRLKASNTVYGSRLYNIVMMRRRPNEIVIPDGKTAEEALQIWIDNQLGSDDQDISTEKEFSISQCAYNFCVRYSRRDASISSELLNYWKRAYVRALMERGLTFKRDSADLSPVAHQDFLRALKVIPENPLACYRLGHLMYKKENLGETIAYFARALDLSLKQQNYPEIVRMSNLQTQYAQELLSNSIKQLYEFLPKDDDSKVGPLEQIPIVTFSEDDERTSLFYTKIVGRKKEEERIGMSEYYEKLDELEGDSEALVIDRLLLNPYVRYMTKDQPLDENHKKLHYLLYCLGLEETEEELRLVSYDSIRATISRLNQNLRSLGVSEDKFRVRYTLAEKFHTSGQIDIHYFRSIYYI